MTYQKSTFDRDDVIDQYNGDLIDRWDALINWSQREAGEKTFFIDQLHAFGAHSVLDAAAGTGYHAIRLSQAGFDLTAVDICPDMIARTVANATAHGVTLSAKVGNWLDLDDNLAPFDAIVCLGSSFPHLLDPRDREKALANFHSLLRPGGCLILDHRNFDAIRAGRYANTAGLYYAGNSVRVTPTLIGDTCQFQYDFPDGAQHHLRVAAVPCDTMRAELAQAGFQNISTFGDFRADFALNEVGFIIHVAQRVL